MNFTPELSAFQGAIISADNLHQFSTLSAKGGNEDAINSVIMSLKTFLEQGFYIVDDKISPSQVAQVRKFALYIVLNADLPELQQLIESEEISTLIWTTPTIPKCLMCELIWNMNMEKFITEIISYANPQLALEVASAFLDHVKYEDPMQCLQRLLLLSSACYTLICRLHLFKFQSSELHTKSRTALNNLQQSLKYYTTPPNNYKLNALHKADLYKYQGKCLHSLLQLMDHCLAQFTSRINSNSDKIEFYKLTYEENSLLNVETTFTVNESPNNILLECLNNANISMLDTCKVLVMDVSVDVFCCWSEFEEHGKSMQQTIGELCFKVHSKLSNVTSLTEHPLINMLEQISRKPVEMKEVINASNDEDILKHISQNNEESKAWIKALAQKEKLYQSSQLLNVVYSNIDIYDADESYQLYSIIKQGCTSDADNIDLIELVLVKVFEKCELSKKYEILEERFDKKTFVDMKETQEFKNAMTSVFNKFVATTEVNFTEVLTLFLQNPKQIFAKIFTLACENAQQNQIMVKIMQLLERFRDHFYSTDTESCIIHITQNICESLESDQSQEDNFIQFIISLKAADIVQGTKLLLLVIMTNIHKALLNNGIEKLSLQLRLLREAYSTGELVEYRAPILAMLAYILEKVRWQIHTFTANAPSTLNLALDIQDALIQTYNGVVPVKEKYWLQSKLRSLKPLNMYYYRVLWDPPGLNYVEIVSGRLNIGSLSFNTLCTWLSQVIISCTLREWCEIWDSLIMFENDKIFNIFHAALAVVSAAERINRTDKTAACMLYCLKNYVHMIRYDYLSVPLIGQQVQSVIRKVAIVTDWVDDTNTQELMNIVMPLFAYFMEKRFDYSLNLTECINRYLSNTKLSPMINKIFQNGEQESNSS